MEETYKPLNVVAHPWSGTDHHGSKATHALAMATDMETMRAEIIALSQRLMLAEQHGVQAAEALDKLRAETDGALKAANARMDGGFGGRDREDRMELVDVKTMQPTVFKGGMQESYKQWAKKVKAFCNSRKAGFRQALDWAEKETVPVTEDTLKVLSWAPAEAANAKLYDMLVMHLADDPLILVENHLNAGFEAWRALSRRYDPIGEQFVFDQMTSLLHRERCKDIGDLPGALERWTRDLSLYEKKTGQTLQKEWRVPINLPDGAQRELLRGQSPMATQRKERHRRVCAGADRQRERHQTRKES